MLENKTVAEVMDMVNSLRDQGVRQGTDFDFKYTPPSWDAFDRTPSNVLFTFYTEKYATMFTLRWA